MLRFIPLFFLLMAFNGYSQERDTLKVLSYNLLNFPNVSPNRIDTLKKILAHIKPDIFMACEITSGAGADDILFNALNEDGESAYDMVDYVAGPDTENMLYFNSDKLGLVDQNEIETVLRDINEYVLYYKATDIETTTDTTYFYIYVCHLKASSGFEAQRNTEITALKNYLAGRPEAENIIIGGDFNFYSSETEPAWNTLLTGGDVIIKDPLTLPGSWHADPGFAWVHTQSTRTAEFDGGAFGGMDDRFDFIFIGDDLKTFSNDAKYVKDSYRAVGQDGLHYNGALIDDPVNTSEPWPIITALYHMSDHLPVYMEVEVVKEGAAVQEWQKSDFQAYYDSSTNYIRFREFDTLLAESNFELYNVHGQLLQSLKGANCSQGIAMNAYGAGTYILKVEGIDFSLKFTKP